MPTNNFLASFNHAIEGLVHTLRTQKNMKVHFFLASLVLIASLFLDLTRLELIALFFQ